MERIKDQCGFKNMFVVDSQGGSGDLAMLWSAEVFCGY